MQRSITVQDVEDIAVGGGVLGTGGGGDPYLGKLMAQQAIEKHGSPRMISLRHVPDDKLIMVAAGIGAPAVILEKFLRGDEAVGVFQALQRHLGKKAYAVMSAEAGGLNGTIPISVAARLKIPLVDADLMGRAFPEVQLVTPTLHGVPASPLIIVDEKGNQVILQTINNEWTERISRNVSVQMGAIALMALFPMNGKTAKKATLAGSISLALRIGQTLRLARKHKRNLLGELLRVTRGLCLFQGKIVDLNRRIERGHVRGEVTIHGSEKFSGSSMNVKFQNENLVALVDGRYVATVPDLITVLDQDTAYPITTENLKYGLRVTVVGIPCNRAWRTRAGIQLAGPHHFGYEVPYRPLRRRT